MSKYGIAVLSPRGKRLVAIIFLITSFIGAFAPMQSFAASTQDDDVLTKEQAMQTLNGPVFLDAYWVDRNSSTDTTAPIRKEVGPGDGTSTLAIVLANRGTSEITAVTGTLTLPDGFSFYGTNGAATSTAQASFNQLVGAGDTFTLYFDVNVSDKARVGIYTTNLKVEFNRVREVGAFRDEDLTIPFRLTGKVILDPLAITHNLVPGVTNNVDFVIRNAGSAPATGVQVSINGLTVNGGDGNGSDDSTDSGSSSSSQGQLINSGSSAFNVGSVPANSSVTLTAEIFPNTFAAGKTSSIQLAISYNDAYGNSKTLSRSVGLVVLPNAPTAIDIKAASFNASSIDGYDVSRIVAGKVDDFVLDVENKGAIPITNAVVSMTSESDSIKILGDSKWAVDSVDAQSDVRLPTKIYAAPSLIGTPASFDITLDYLLNGEPKTEQFVLGTYVDGEITLRLYDLAVNYVGNEPTLVGNLLNEGNTAAFFTTIEITQQSSIANSNNGDNATFGGGQRQQGEQSQFGGQQQQQQQSFNFQRAGADPSRQASPQYIGDLTANSPIPFSIPIDAFRSALGAGPLSVTLKVSYKDGLRNAHEFTTTQNVTISAPPISATGAGFRNRSQGPGMLVPIIIGVVVAVAAAAASIIIIKRKRKQARLTTLKDQNNGKKENIEDILEKPAATAAVEQKVDRQHSADGGTDVK